MRLDRTIAQIFLIFSLANVTLAAPVLIRQRHLNIAEVALEKRGPGSDDEATGGSTSNSMPELASDSGSDHYFPAPKSLDDSHQDSPPTSSFHEGEGEHLYSPETWQSPWYNSEDSASHHDPAPGSPPGSSHYDSAPESLSGSSHYDSAAESHYDSASDSEESVNSAGSASLHEWLPDSTSGSLHEDPPTSPAGSFHEGGGEDLVFPQTGPAGHNSEDNSASHHNSEPESPSGPSGYHSASEPPSGSSHYDPAFESSTGSKPELESDSEGSISSAGSASLHEWLPDSTSVLSHNDWSPTLPAGPLQYHTRPLAYWQVDRVWASPHGSTPAPLSDSDSWSESSAGSMPELESDSEEPVNSPEPLAESGPSLHLTTPASGSTSSHHDSAPVSADPSTHVDLPSEVDKLFNDKLIHKIRDNAVLGTFASTSTSSDVIGRGGGTYPRPDPEENLCSMVLVI